MVAPTALPRARPRRQDDGVKRGPRWHFRVAPPEPEAAAAAAGCGRLSAEDRILPEASAHTRRLETGTRVPTRIIVARLPAGPAARYPSAAAAVPLPGGGHGQGLTPEEAAPAPHSAAGSRRCRAARTRRWGEAGA